MMVSEHNAISRVALRHSDIREKSAVKLFECPSCRNVIYFENRFCGTCGHRVGYLPEAAIMLAFDPDGDSWRPVGTDGPNRFFCRNAEQDACNWLVPDGSTDAYCAACRHNGTVPELATPGNLLGWQELEFGKHRLFYSLLRWRLPLRTRAEDPEHGLIFNFLADRPNEPKVMTGHDNGVITIALTEADDLERERRRLQMGEPYRTILGHFRHEVGHHFWDVLVRDGGKLDACRAVFGDDSVDYDQALKDHYANGAPADWQQNFVSAYASTHPWEDFAETWAHYLHIVDTLEMAGAFGLDVKPQLDHIGGLSAHFNADPYEATGIDPVIAAWLPFVFTINAVSRTMGTRDLYPFVLSPAVIAKLGFIHDLVHSPQP
jgi:hypothetical protein